MSIAIITQDAPTVKDLAAVHSAIADARALWDALCVEWRPLNAIAMAASAEWRWEPSPVKWAAYWAAQQAANPAFEAQYAAWERLNALQTEQARLYRALYPQVFGEGN